MIFSFSRLIPVLLNGMKYSDTDIMSLKVVEDVIIMFTISPLLMYTRVILRMMLMCLIVSRPSNLGTIIQRHTVNTSNNNNNNSRKRCSVMASWLHDLSRCPTHVVRLKPVALMRMMMMKMKTLQTFFLTGISVSYWLFVDCANMHAVQVNVVLLLWIVCQTSSNKTSYPFYFRC